MRRILLFGTLAAMLFPAVTFAQSKFDGTWKIDLSKMQIRGKPTVLLLQNGIFKCETCVPSYTVKADGADHPLSGDPYSDVIAVKLAADGRLELTQKKAGKIVTRSTMSLSSDGKILQIAFEDASATNSKPVTGKMSFSLVTKGPAGSSPISGSWEPAKAQDISENGLVFSLRIKADAVKFSNPTGQSYEAKLNGTEVAYNGDPGITTVSVRRVDSNTIEETDKRNGKPISTTQMRVSPDGKSLMLTYRDLREGTTQTDIAVKQ